MQITYSYIGRGLIALLLSGWLLIFLTPPGFAQPMSDEAQKVVVDASGNVYVTGHSQNGTSVDYVTLKYDSTGAWLWGRRFSGAANGDDVPVDLKVDISGNAYVTGYSYNGANYDYVTIKYDSNGNWLWGRRFNGPANDDDEAGGLAVDSNGNVLVTGQSWNGANNDYVTIKYDSNGTWVWGRRYNGPANDYDEAAALAVDASDNVYVTGQSWNGANWDYVTIKYGASGNWVWGRRYNGSANDADHAKGLAVDTGGNVYVTGQSRNGANLDFVTIKYDPSGSWVWGRRYNGPANGDDDPNDLAVDTSGNVYLTGYSYNGANTIFAYDYVTLKYSTSGTWVWGRRYNGPADSSDVAKALAVDASGDVYVTGSSSNGDNGDYVTIKYSPSGVWLWGQRYNSPANSDDKANALAVDATGNVLVTGESLNGSNYDYVTIKYDTGGVWLWGARYDGPD